MLKAWLYRGFNCQILAIFVTAALSFGAGADAVPEINQHVITFDNGNFYEATVSRSVPVNGRYLTVKTQPTFTGGNCGDILQGHQTRPLNVMRDAGYISEKIHQKLSNFEKLGIAPESVTIISQTSDLTPQEEIEIFGPRGSPPDRVVKGRWELDPGKIRVTRGNIFIVRGYVLREDESGKLVPEKRDMPWELEALPQGITRKIDSKKIPYAIELGRLHAEGKPLAGNVKLLMQTVTAILANEMQILKVDPKKVLVTGHFLDAEHVRFITKAFHLRILNDEVLDQIEAAGRVTENYTDLPLPDTHDGWAKHTDTVCFTSAGHMLGKFPIENFSEKVAQLTRIAAPVPLSGVAALAITREYLTNIREDFDFNIEPFGKSRAPLMVFDYGTPLLGYKMVSTLRKRGFEFNGPQMNQALDFLGRQDNAIAPDMFGYRWLERAMFLPMNRADGKLTPGMIVSNLDFHLFRKGAHMYLAAIILSIADLVDKRIDAFDPENFGFFLQSINEERTRRGLPKVATADAETFFDSYPLYLAARDINFQILLTHEMKGVSVKAPAMTAQFTSGPITGASQSFHMSAQMIEETIYGFDGAKLRKIRREYHAFNHEARKRLDKSSYEARLKLLQAGSF